MTAKFRRFTFKQIGFDPLIIYANEEEYLPPAAVGQSVLELYDYVDFGR
jgi:hypothetical protein